MYLQKVLPAIALALVTACVAPSQDNYSNGGGGGSSYSGGEPASVTQDRSGVMNPGEVKGPDTGGGFGPIRG